MAGWTVPRWGGALEDTDGASCLLSGRYKRYGAGPRDRSALVRPDDYALRSGIPLSLLCRLVHGFRLLSHEPCWLAAHILFTQPRRIGILGSSHSGDSRKFISRLLYSTGPQDHGAPDWIYWWGY